VCLLLFNAVLSGQEIEVEKGEIDGAPFRIQIPEEWNRGLVMYAHGYRPRGGGWYPLNEFLCAVFLDRGWAVAESGYSRQGWAVEEAVRETEALRQYFVKTRGKADRTFVTGHSMGGVISLATIEGFPDHYDGALPMCGPLLPAVRFFKDPVFDMLVTFEALFGEGLPDELKPVIEAAQLPREAIGRALVAEPDLAARYAAHWRIREADLAEILWLYHLLYRELCDRAGGNPIDNRNTVYTGIEPIRESKKAVRRYAAAPRALAYLRRHYTPTGKLEDPVLAVHTAYDPGVPPGLANDYDTTVSLRGCETFFVHKYVDAEGHCNIAPEFLGKAFDQLVEWAGDGVRPEPGLLR